MSFLKSSSRYNSFDTRSSTQSDPSSSIDLYSQKRQTITSNSSRALVRAKSSEVSQGKPKQDQNFGAMVKKFMEKKSSASKSKSSNRTGLIVPADFIAEDLKKTARKGSNFTALHKKLFSKGSGLGKEKSEVKALTEIKSNTRTLAMVLRSERELLSQNKEQETEITQLKLFLDERNREVEKLKDLCLKQREEIKSLKSAVLFPDDINSQLQELLEKQSSELNQAKQLIPNLQRQVTSLTGQLQYLADDLAEVKADKASGRGIYDGYISSPRTPTYDHEEAANSLEFSSGDHTTPGSPDEMFLKDLNPCLTPYYTDTKPKDIGVMEKEEKSTKKSNHKIDFSSGGWKLSKSSDYYSNSGSTSAAQVARRSDESKCRSAMHMKNKHY